MVRILEERSYFRGILVISIALSELCVAMINWNGCGCIHTTLQATNTSAFQLLVFTGKSIVSHMSKHKLGKKPQVTISL